MLRIRDSATHPQVFQNGPTAWEEQCRLIPTHQIMTATLIRWGKCWHWGSTKLQAYSRRQYNVSVPFCYPTAYQRFKNRNHSPFLRRLYAHNFYASFSV